MTKNPAWTNLNDIDGFSQEKGAPDYWDDAVQDFWADCELDTETDLRVIVKWFDKRRVLNILNRNLVQLRTIGQALLGVTLPDMPNTPCQRLLRVATEKVWRTMESDWPDNEKDAAKALDKLRGAYDELTDCANSMSREHLIVAADVLRWGDELRLVIRNIVEGVDDDRD